MNSLEVLLHASKLKLVIVESPYAGDVATHTLYAKRCIRHSLLQSEAPIASHLLFTQPGILRDDVPDEREVGIAAGLAWYLVAQACIVYEDYGITQGMRLGIRAAQNVECPIYYRKIGRIP